MSWHAMWWVTVATAALAASARAPAPAGHDRLQEQQMPPAPAAQGDPADSLYRAARAALARRDYRGASELFAAIDGRFAGSRYAQDALYWQAFALYREGRDASLRRALASLKAQRERYPKAATRGDAAALERRIQGELARRGDPDAAAVIAAEAARIAAPPEPPARPAPPMPPSPPGAQGTSARVAVVVPASGCESDDDGNDDIKVAALNALQQMDPERAAPILRKVLSRRDAASVCLRRKAVFLVPQLQPEGAEETLLEAARSDPDAVVREQAVFWLSQVGTERSVAALDSILRTTTDPNTQEKAVFALSQQGSPRADQALRTYALRSDVPEDARGKAIFWLSQTGAPDNATFLEQLYGRLQEVELKKKVLLSISQMDTEQGGRWLVQVARNPQEAPELRKQALFWAEQCEVPTSEFAALYASSRDRAMREQLIFVLYQRGDKAAADKLFEIARSDPDRELRKKALFWLGQMDDPRVADVLQQILEQ